MLFVPTSKSADLSYLRRQQSRINDVYGRLSCPPLGCMALH